MSATEQSVKFLENLEGMTKPLGPSEPNIISAFQNAARMESGNNPSAAMGRDVEQGIMPVLNTPDPVKVEPKQDNPVDPEQVNMTGYSLRNSGIQNPKLDGAPYIMASAARVVIDLFSALGPKPEPQPEEADMQMAQLNPSLQANLNPRPPKMPGGVF